MAQGSTPSHTHAHRATARRARTASRVPPAGFTSEHATLPTPKPASMGEAWAAATRRGALTARDSKHVLILFSGPYRRPDGLAAYLRQHGLEVTMLDNDTKHGGEHDDITRDDVYNALMTRVRAGHFLAVFAAPPCSTFSVTRWFESEDSTDGGPPPVRDRNHPEGLNDIPPGHERELADANLVVQRTAALLAAAYEAGTQFALEHPADRGNPASTSIYLDERHCPLWLFPDVIELRKQTHSKLSTFAQCMLGAEHQKYTTFMYTAGLDAPFAHLDDLRCTHKEHSSQVGGKLNKSGKWRSSKAAAYPADMNILV